jgi:hypothetical protein
VRSHLRDPTALAPIRRSGTHWLKGFAGFRAGWDTLDKIIIICFAGIRTPDNPLSSVPTPLPRLIREMYLVGGSCHAHCAWQGPPTTHPTTFHVCKTRGCHCSFKAHSHIACRAHAVSLPCLTAKGLEFVFHIWFTQCGPVWFTLAMSRPFHALTMPFFSRPRRSTAVEWRPVGYLPAFGFFRQPRRVPRIVLSEAYKTSSQRSIPTTAKSCISTLQKRQFVKLLD